VVFLFADNLEYEEASWDKVMTKDGVAGLLESAQSLLTALENWTAEAIETELRAMLGEMGVGVGKGLQPLRVAVTGSSVSPPLFESLTALGKERTLDRLARARLRVT
jgi:glutamyl-tRNA synthetase